MYADGHRRIAIAIRHHLQNFGDEKLFQLRLTWRCSHSAEQPLVDHRADVPPPDPEHGRRRATERHPLRKPRADTEEVAIDHMLPPHQPLALDGLPENGHGLALAFRLPEMQEIEFLGTGRPLE